VKIEAEGDAQADEILQERLSESRTTISAAVTCVFVGACGNLPLGEKAAAPAG
jgi:regulator of protease activity HflC (stomatin/prohibitin superfamily)